MEPLAVARSTTESEVSAPAATTAVDGGTLLVLPRLNEDMSNTKRRFIKAIMKEKASNPPESQGSSHLLGCRGSIPVANRKVPPEDQPETPFQHLEWGPDERSLRAKPSTRLAIKKAIKQNKERFAQTRSDVNPLNDVNDVPFRTELYIHALHLWNLPATFGDGGWKHYYLQLIGPDTSPHKLVEFFLLLPMQPLLRELDGIGNIGGHTEEDMLFSPKWVMGHHRLGDAELMRLMEPRLPRNHETEVVPFQLCVALPAARNADGGIWHCFGCDRKHDHTQLWDKGKRNHKEFFEKQLTQTTENNVRYSDWIYWETDGHEEYLDYINRRAREVLLDYANQRLTDPSHMIDGDNVERYGLKDLLPSWEEMSACTELEIFIDPAYEQTRTGARHYFDRQVILGPSDCVIGQEREWNNEIETGRLSQNRPRATDLSLIHI